ncbi:hypothetical protein INR49_003973 [Caranx melampygus]|nr:hypothetical protein INR49_003973 [Caranx melampygus]
MKDNSLHLVEMMLDLIPDLWMIVEETAVTDSTVMGRLVHIPAEHRPPRRQELWEEHRGELLLGKEELSPRRGRRAPGGWPGGRAPAHGGGHPRLVVRLQRSGHVELVKREIRRSVSLCSPPGPHVFLLTVKASSAFSEKRRRAVEEPWASWGAGVEPLCGRLSPPPTTGPDTPEQKGGGGGGLGLAQGQMWSEVSQCRPE